MPNFPTVPSIARDEVAERLEASRAAGQLVVICDIDETAWLDRKGVTSAAASLAAELLEIEPEHEAMDLAARFYRHAEAIRDEWARSTERRELARLLDVAHIGTAEILSLDGDDFGPTHPDLRIGARELLTHAANLRRQAWHHAVRSLYPTAGLGDPVIEDLAVGFPHRRREADHRLVAPGFVDLLRSLWQREVPIGFLTNGLWTSQNPKFEAVRHHAATVAPEVDWEHVLRDEVRQMSGNLGLAKPQPATLRLAVEAAAGGCLEDPATTVVMYGDNPERDGRVALNLHRQLDLSGRTHGTVLFGFYDPFPVMPARRLDLAVEERTVRFHSHRAAAAHLGAPRRADAIVR